MAAPISLIIVTGVLGFLLGAALRHLQGGLDAALGMHRWQVVAAYTLLGIPAGLVYWHTPWLGGDDLGILKAVLMVGLFDLHMVLWLEFNKPWKVAYHYGIAPFLVALITGCWPVALVGPAFAIGTALLRNRVVAITPPWIDGWEAWWEIMLGGVSGLAWVVAPLIGRMP